MLCGSRPTHCCALRRSALYAGVVWDEALLPHRGSPAGKVLSRRPPRDYLHLPLGRADVGRPGTGRGGIATRRGGPFRAGSVEHLPLAGRLPIGVDAAVGQRAAAACPPCPERSPAGAKSAQSADDQGPLGESRPPAGGGSSLAVLALFLAFRAGLDRSLRLLSVRGVAKLEPFFPRATR